MKFMAKLSKFFTVSLYSTVSINNFSTCPSKLIIITSLVIHQVADESSKRTAGIGFPRLLEFHNVGPEEPPLVTKPYARCLQAISSHFVRKDDKLQHKTERLELRIQFYRERTVLTSAFVLLKAFHRSPVETRVYSVFQKEATRMKIVASRLNSPSCSTCCEQKAPFQIQPAVAVRNFSASAGCRAASLACSLPPCLDLYNLK
ncbi:uncharacterized protein [Anser cygnoides]|uniref:uncharacterized protein n=1 Tax=Anser cygnoides TaxID=8845 RepID=UPI0034D3361A